MANEKRLDLIDRKALGIGYCNPLAFDEIEYAHGWNCVIEILMKAPNVDAVEVVRCKDCKSCDPGYIRQDHGWCKEWGTAVRASGFCHHGERRADG